MFHLSPLIKTMYSISLSTTALPSTDLLHLYQSPLVAANPNLPSAMIPAAVPCPRENTISDNRFQFARNEFSVLINNLKNGCHGFDSPSSLPGRREPAAIHKSVSSHSLHQNEQHCGILASQNDVVQMKTSPLRRVFSAGDLQCGGKGESSLSCESNMIIESIGKAHKYGPEEKKERIERYRSKRNQRDFNKKIKYACRKTLADSRPRIRGRFARNDDGDRDEHHAQQWRKINRDENYEDDDIWINFLEAFSSTSFPY